MSVLSALTPPIPSGRAEPINEARALHTVLTTVDLLDSLFIWAGLLSCGWERSKPRIGHDIPCVVDANEQEQHRYRSDDEQRRYRLTREQNRGDDEGGRRRRAARPYTTASRRAPVDRPDGRMPARAR
jgi:hypothetical protein